MMGWDVGFGWGGMVFGGLMMIVFWGGLIALLVLAVRGFSNVGNTAGQSGNSATLNSQSPDKPLDIRQARYARGEISQQEYEAVREDLLAAG